MTASWLRRLSASPWLDAGIGVAVTVATWIELWAPVRHDGAGRLAAVMVLAVGLCTVVIYGSASRRGTDEPALAPVPGLARVGVLTTFDLDEY